MPPKNNKRWNPKRGNTKRRGKKRVYKKKNYKNKINTINVHQAMQADAMFIKLKWWDPNVSAGGTFGQTLYNEGEIFCNNVYSINTLYQPDLVNAANINYISDYSGLYFYYRVHAAKITVSFTNTQEANNTFVYLSIMNTTPGVDNVNFIKLSEQNGSIKKMIGSNQGQPKQTISMYVDMKKMYGSKEYIYRSQTGATLTTNTTTITNPMDQIYAVLGMVNANGHVMDGNFGVDYIFAIEWYIKFFDRQKGF